MSMQAINYAMTLPVDDPGPRLLLFLIAHHVNWKTGDMYVSQKELADEVRCSERSVRTYLHALIEEGILTREETREGGRRGVDRITLVGYLEWQAVLYEGGTIPSPNSRKRQPAKFAGSDSQPAKSDTSTGKIPPTNRQTVAGIKEPLLTIDNHSACARAREGAHTPTRKARPSIELRRDTDRAAFDAWMTWLSDEGKRDAVAAAQAAGVITCHSRWPTADSHPPQIDGIAWGQAIEARKQGCG